MKRSLEEILLEARRITIKDKEEVMDCINRLGDRSLISLLEPVEDDLKGFGDFRGSISFRIINSYEELSDLYYSQKKNALMNITFKEFMCLIESAGGDDEDCFDGRIMNEVTNILDYIFVLLRIRGDKDVGDFMRIDFNVLKDICSKEGIELPHVFMPDIPNKMLLDYIDRQQLFWKCKFFRICSGYNISKVKSHFLELAYSCKLDHAI